MRWKLPRQPGKSLAELRDVDQPAWPSLEAAARDSAVSVIVLLVDPARAEAALVRLQVTAASTLGGMALNCGGLLVDHGWLRILGGGCVDLPDLASANDLGDQAKVREPPPSLVVAYDVLGGVFAVDGGGLAVAPGEVCYRGPDSLEWIGLGTGHTGFVHFTLSGGLDDFYASLRWPGWEDEVSALDPSLGLSLYPPPFTKEGADIASVSRRSVPLAEVVGYYADMAHQVKEMPDGQAFSIRPVD